MQIGNGLINTLQHEMNEIMENLNRINGNSTKQCLKCSCFGKNSKKLKKKRHIPPEVAKLVQPLIYNIQQEKQYYEGYFRLTALKAETKQKKDNQKYLHKIQQIIKLNKDETNANQRKLQIIRNHLIQHQSIENPFQKYEGENLVQEVNLATNFYQINTHLDHLYDMTSMMSKEVDKHNQMISKIEKQAIEGAELVTQANQMGKEILGIKHYQNIRDDINSEIQHKQTEMFTKTAQQPFNYMLDY
ncbi:unnamed protein product [Didymodactylos carnosus]|uniref:Uncharacterized protein n=1 Tax=Didymodactylos carnosus TaxID=1234261 RepID=A0A813SQG0_9BILA|nr:unnamed protein product [Didymodactylos carnosus]CAF0884362.1 unnamed protein product [Didymodactylos carnosus]CAF3583252.1 unnamed protein product [Didymodactylos carnosus]CAF3667551.1 unnamed protein product [Didymodactylos carnosus]